MHSPQQTILIKEPPAVAHNFCPDPDSCGLLKQALSQKAEIEAENEKLRQIFTLAQNEFEKRNKRIEYLLQEISFLREIERENKNLKQQLEQALAKANLFSRMLYGRKTEKGQSGQTESASITPESNESRQEQDYGNEKKKTRGATPGHKGYGRKIPDNLPVREQIIDIPEDKKKCDCCGEALIEQPELDQISFEISSEKIYYIKKIVRKAYTKACDCPETRAIVVAIPPPKIIPKGKFSIEFWAECLLNKYMMHLPVQRQLLDMKLNNLPVSAGTIFGSFEKLHSLYLEPLYRAMAIQLRKASHWHADESRWYVFIELEGKDNHKWMMWCFASEDIVLFVLDPTRAAKVPCQTLFDINIEELEKATNGKPLFEHKTKVSKILNADRYLSV